MISIVLLWSGSAYLIFAELVYGKVLSTQCSELLLDVNIHGADSSMAWYLRTKQAGKWKHLLKNPVSLTHHAYISRNISKKS